MKPFFCRLGSKRYITDIILKDIPKHKIYVEPFIGSGAVLFAKEPSEIEIINDLDKNLIKAWRNLKNSSKTFKLPPMDSLAKQLKIFKTNYKNPTMNAIKYAITSCGGFNNLKVGNKIYQRTGVYKKDISKYIDRLKDVSIYNKDYASVIKQYVSPETFIYLDPPYEESQGIYKFSNIDLEKLEKLLSGLKSKWLLSLNDSPTVRDIFKGYPMKVIKINYRGGTTNERNELLISS